MMRTLSYEDVVGVSRSDIRNLVERVKEIFGDKAYLISEEYIMDILNVPRYVAAEILLSLYEEIQRKRKEERDLID